MSRYGFQLAAGMYKAGTFETLTITTAAATSLSSVVYGGTNANIIRALITAESSDIRYRFDGVAPTVSVGHILGAGGAVEFMGRDNITQVQFIATSGSATIMVTYEKDFRY